MKWCGAVLLILLTVRMLYATEETTTFGPFGEITLYYSSATPSNVVLFISGDGGWRKGVLDMAHILMSMDTLVIGFSINTYIKSMKESAAECAYPAADLEDLSHFVQKKLNYSKYVPPIIVGYSSGATLAYAVLVQAPPTTFRGAISFGFCPDLLLPKPLCRGNGLEWTRGTPKQGFIFEPATSISAPWIAFQGTTDMVCNDQVTEDFVKKVHGGEIVILPRVGHGFGKMSNWVPNFKDSYINLTEKTKTVDLPRPEPIKDLPIVEVPAAGGHDTGTLAIIISGDGGWAGIDRQLGDALATEGIPVAGLNSLQYFWHKKTPDETAKDLERMIHYYMETWKKDKIILIGYSLGADVLPFMVSRLPTDLIKHTREIALLGLEETVAFEFHFTEWLGSSSKDELPVKPEVEKLKGMKILCFCGEEETDSLCRKLEPSIAKTVVMPGAHHMGGKYDDMARQILQEAGLAKETTK